MQDHVGLCADLSLFTDNLDKLPRWEGRCHFPRRVSDDEPFIFQGCWVLNFHYSLRHLNVVGHENSVKLSLVNLVVLNKHVEFFKC